MCFVAHDAYHATKQHYSPHCCDRSIKYVMYHCTDTSHASQSTIVMRLICVSAEIMTAPAFYAQEELVAFASLIMSFTAAMNMLQPELHCTAPQHSSCSSVF